MKELSVVPRSRDEARERNFVEALARGLDVLRAFADSPGTLGNQEIAERTSLPKATVSRLTYTLMHLGYLRYSTHVEKFELDTGVLALGYLYLSKLKARRLAEPIMGELSRATRTSIGLTARSRLSLDMVYLESFRATELHAIRMEVGSHVPIATSSAGRAYFAALCDKDRQSLLAHIEEITSLKFWHKIRKGLEDAVEDYMNKGYCVSLGDWERTINACAVPVDLGDGVILSLSCGATANFVTEARIESEFSFQLIQAARDIQSALGIDRRPVASGSA